MLQSLRVLDIRVGKAVSFWEFGGGTCILGYMRHEAFGQLGRWILSQLSGRSSTVGFGSTDGFGDQYIFNLTKHDRCA
jgi:hypothetical protein